MTEFTKWGSEEIKFRGKSLGEKAAKIWIGPAVPIAAPDAGNDAGEGRGRRQSVLSVVIDWKQTGRALEKETICESASSATLAKVLSRLVQVLGVQVLETCGQISSARGPLVSQDPSKDFLIQATGQTYQNQAVAGTQWYVLTNNSTDEKVELLNAIPAHLGYSREMLFVDKITRGEALLRIFDV